MAAYNNLTTANLPKQSIAIQTIANNDRFNSLKSLRGVVKNIIHYKNKDIVKEMIRQQKISTDFLGGECALCISLKDRKHNGPQTTINVFFFASWAQQLIENGITVEDELQIVGLILFPVHKKEPQKKATASHCILS